MVVHTSSFCIWETEPRRSWVLGQSRDSEILSLKNKTTKHKMQLFGRELSFPQTRGTLNAEKSTPWLGWSLSICCRFLMKGKDSTSKTEAVEFHMVAVCHSVFESLQNRCCDVTRNWTSKWFYVFMSKSWNRVEMIPVCLFSLAMYRVEFSETGTAQSCLLDKPAASLSRSLRCVVKC